jgi:hypothetical protein
VTSPLRRSRADALRIILADRQGYLFLDQSAYRWLAGEGWSRSAVDNAVDDLAELGEVEIIAGSGALQVRMLEGAQS